MSERETKNRDNQDDVFEKTVDRDRIEFSVKPR